MSLKDLFVPEKCFDVRNEIWHLISTTKRPISLSLSLYFNVIHAKLSPGSKPMGIWSDKHLLTVDAHCKLQHLASEFFRMSGINVQWSMLALLLAWGDFAC